MSVREIVSPVVRYGGKARAAPLVWEAIGDPHCFIDPFAGSLAVPLRAPHVLKKVVLNDLDDLLVNFWRALQQDPEGVAYWADYPTSHTDLIARREWLRQQWPEVRRTMKVDPEWYDVKVAGWWAWGTSNSIDLMRLEYPSEESQKWYKAARADALSQAKGVPSLKEGSTSPWTGAPAEMRDGRSMPKIGGQGVSAQREGYAHSMHPAGADRRAVTGWAPSRSKEKPGVVHPEVAETWAGAPPEMGHGKAIPNMGPKGVNAQRGGMTDTPPGALHQGMPFVALWGGGQGVTAQRTDRMCTKHPDAAAISGDRLMPEDPTPFTGERLTPWLMDLARKIQRWIILCKDWRDVVSSRSITSTTGTQPGTVCGIFLDPPYNRKSIDRGALYSTEDFDVADDVFDWLITHDPRYGYTPWENPQFRIVLCGYSSDYRVQDLPGARVVPWRRGGGMERTGDASLAGERAEPRQEVLVLSPACLAVVGEQDPGGSVRAPDPAPARTQPMLL